jgi:2-polyprenyl-3-methyl-5-hydroxy-6-metoxy-1,4-benzoquinol methylase
MMVKKSIYRLSKNEIQKLTSIDIKGSSDQNVDEMAIPSYLHANPLIRWLMWRRFEYVAQCAKLTKNMTVLDFGCGIGVFLPTLSHSAGIVYDIDLFPEYAKKLVDDLQLQVTFIDNLSDLAEESLDVIIAVDSIEHLADPQECILAFRNKLKRQGRFIICGPTENKFYKLGKIVAGFANRAGYHHSNIDKLEIIIRNNNFNLIRSYSLPFITPLSLFRIFEFEKG